MKRVRRTILSLSLLLLFAFPVSGDYRRVVRSVQLLTARIDGHLRPICTTASINEEMHLWITAAHCVDAGPLFIQQQPVSTVVVWNTADLALLFTPTFAAPALRVADEAPEVGDKVSVVGYPFGIKQPQLFQGYVSSVGMDIVYGHKYGLDVTICGGNSGSPVVNKQDELVSVIQAGIDSPQGCYVFTAGATLQDIRGLLDVIQARALPNS